MSCLKIQNLLFHSSNDQAQNFVSINRTLNAREDKFCSDLASCRLRFIFCFLTTTNALKSTSTLTFFSVGLMAHKFLVTEQIRKNQVDQASDTTVQTLHFACKQVFGTLAFAIELRTSICHHKAFLCIDTKTHCRFHNHNSLSRRPLAELAIRASVLLG